MGHQIWAKQIQNKKFTCKCKNGEVKQLEEEKISKMIWCSIQKEKKIQSHQKSILRIQDKKKKEK